MKNFRFIDLFSGIGGFHLGLSPLGGECVMASDIDPTANETYYNNFGIKPWGDICDIRSKEIPAFDLLSGGFPCQSFSNVGQKGGLEDPRGGLIFQVVRILSDCKPKCFILENVKGLVSHNKGKTLQVIINKLEEIGYKVYYEVLEAKDYGLPQIRKRLFIVGILKKVNYKFVFPKPIPLKYNLEYVLDGKTEREYAFTIRIGGRRSGINNKFNWDCYLVNGKPHYITSEQCLLLQGFPKGFRLSGNESQKLKQVGNSVPVTIVKEIGKKLVNDKIL